MGEEKGTLGHGRIILGLIIKGHYKEKDLIWHIYKHMLLWVSLYIFYEDIKSVIMKQHELNIIAFYFIFFKIEKFDMQIRAVRELGVNVSKTNKKLI